MSILNHIKNAYNRVKTTLFHPKVNDTMKTVRNSVFLATLGAAGAAQASVSHNTQMSSVQQSGTSEFQAVKMYEVQSGDVLGKIALNHKISLNDLLKNNPNLDVNGLIFPGQKIAIPVDVNKIPTDDNSNIDNIVIVGKKDDEFNTEGERKSPETSEGPSEYNFEIALKNGLSTEKVSMSVVFEYVKSFYPEVFESKDKKKIVDRFIQDYQFYSTNSVLDEVGNMPEILGADGDKQIAQLLSQSGYDGLEMQDILRAMLVVETAGGVGKLYIAQALKTKDKNKQNDLIEKAVMSFVGNAGDGGYYQAIGAWIDHEIKAQNIEGAKYIAGRDRLRNQLREVIKVGISQNKSVDDIMKVMSVLDVRFDLKKMSKIVGVWFKKTYDSLGEYSNLTHLERLKLTFIGYNRGTGAMNSRAKKLNAGGTLRHTIDLKKRLGALNTFKIDNDMQIAYAESKKTKNDTQLPTYLQALSTNTKVALALGQSGLTQSQADLIAAKYNNSEIDFFDGITNTLHYAQENPGEYKQSDIKKLENLLAGYQEININEVANILGIPTDKLTDTQKKIIEKILRAPGGTPEEKLRMILLSTRNYFYNFAKNSSNPYYKELVVKLDTILKSLESQSIQLTFFQKAA